MPALVVAGGELALGGEHRASRRRARAAGATREQQLAHACRSPVADVLGHVERRGRRPSRSPSSGSRLAGEDPQQRALADAVGADEPHVPPGRDAERDALEQQVAARVGVGEVADDDRAHPTNVEPGGTGEAVAA